MSTHSVHQFAEKVAVVSDGSNPIARAVALQLGLLGSFVIVGSDGDSNDANSQMMEELRELGTLAAAVDADLKTAHGADDLVGEVAKRFGRIDLLVNCPNFTSPPDLADSGETDLDASLAKTVRSAYLITQKALPLMAERPRPRIVNVVSGDENALKNPIFAASHAALKGFTLSLGKALPDKFRVNGVSAAFAEPASSAEPGELLFRPPGTLSPDDAARTIVFLLSSEAAAIDGRFIEVG